MNLRRIKHTLLRLSTEEKVIGLGALAVFAGSLMPWYRTVAAFDSRTTEFGAFSGDLGVVGFVVFLLTLLALLTLLGEHLGIRLPRFGYQREQILFFLMGQGAFLVLLTMAVYLRRSLEFTQAELRFGIFTAFAGAFFAAFAAFALLSKLKERQTQAFFGLTPQATPEPTPSLLDANSMSGGEEEMPPPALLEDDDSASFESSLPSETSSQGDYFKRSAGV